MCERVREKPQVAVLAGNYHEANDFVRRQLQHGINGYSYIYIDQSYRAAGRTFVNAVLVGTFPSRSDWWDLHYAVKWRLTPEGQFLYEYEWDKVTHDV